MAMNPQILVLDEPTSQLDPIAASDFLALLGKINRELGITVILTEHRLEDAFPMADRVIVMDDGEVAGIGTHDLLLAENEVYQEIYYSQFPKEVDSHG
mgnify:CR=1 FL=1